MTKDKALTFDLALDAAYLAGFNASGEGYNGEYPFQDHGAHPEQDAGWIKNRDNEITAIKQARALDKMAENARELGLDYEPVTTLFGSLPVYDTTPPAAFVQETVAWVDLLKQAEEVVRSKSLWKKYIDGTPLANDIAVWMANFAQEHTTPPAAFVQETVAWVLLREDEDGFEPIQFYGGKEKPETAAGELKPRFTLRPVCFADTTPPAAPVQEPVAQGSKEHLKIMMEEIAWEGRLELSDALANIDEFYTTPPAAPTVQEPVSMRMPKVGDKVVCLEDESIGTVVYLTAGGSPEIKFDDGSHGTYMLREFAELFGYTTPPAAQRQWVGLTDEEIIKAMPGGIYDCLNDPWDCGVGDGDTLRSIKKDVLRIARAIEAKLKEKNA